MKTHLSLPVTNLPNSVNFYKVLLDVEPAKNYGDYALFITEDPGIELALEGNAKSVSAHEAHYGVAVDSVETVDAALARLQAAGLPVDVERDETCCYAKQTKVWATDPDGRRWETYHVIEDTADRADEDMKCCRTSAEQASSTACCAS